MKAHSPLILAALLLCLLTMPACQQPTSKLTRVVVTGEANVKAPPDTALLIISVVTQNQRALAAQQENARKSDAVIKAVQAAAGTQPEIKTSDYSLQPQQTYRSNRMPSIIGYEARNSVTVTMSELNNVGAVVDAATQAGANSVERVSFILRESNPARGQTLADATRQAMTKAQSIAQSLGGGVVRVVEEHEGGTNDARSRSDEQFGYGANMNANMSADKSSTTTPVAAGSLDVKTQVQLVVEVEAKP